MGYLGWPPETAWHTPIPMILHALDYRIDWAQKTNPFGGKKGKQGGKSKPKPTPEQVKALFAQMGTKRVSHEQ